MGAQSIDEPGSMRAMPQRRQVRSHGRRGILAGLLAAAGMVCVPGGAAGQSKGRGTAASRSRQVPPEIIVGEGVTGLPPAVVDMRAEILSAVETGNIAELKLPIDLNELKPDFGAPPGADAIDHLKALSGDGDGKVVLAVLGTLLAGKWAAIPGGRDIENNRIYVWPHLAELPFDKFSADDLSALEMLAGADAAKAMTTAKRYAGWRLSIGADGVWHSFLRLGSLPP